MAQESLKKIIFTLLFTNLSGESFKNIYLHIRRGFLINISTMLVEDTQNERQICDLLWMTAMWKMTIMLLNVKKKFRTSKHMFFKKKTSHLNDDDNEWVRRCEERGGKNLRKWEEKLAHKFHFLSLENFNFICGMSCLSQMFLICEIFFLNLFFFVWL